MKLFLLTRTDDVGYDEYDSFVIAAHTEYEAREMAAWEGVITAPPTCRVVGQAGNDIPPGVVLGSFRAG